MPKPWKWKASYKVENQILNMTLKHAVLEPENVAPNNPVMEKIVYA
jgi:hypothetical protein